MRHFGASCNLTPGNVAIYQQPIFYYLNQTIIVPTPKPVKFQKKLLD